MRDWLQVLQRDFEVCTATRAGEAIRLLGAVDFDAIVAGFHLEDGSSLRVMKCARKLQPRAARLVTATGPAKILERARAGGLVQHVLARPLSAADITHVVRARLK